MRILVYQMVLLFLVSFVFAVLGMSLFGELELDKKNEYGALNQHKNFSTFTQSCLALFSIVYFDGWVHVMRDIMSTGGSYAYAWIYFVTYAVLVSYLFLNIIVAVMVEQYGFTARSAPDGIRARERIIDAEQAVFFTYVWSLYDPNASHFVPAHHIPAIIKQLPPPMGLGPDADKVSVVWLLWRWRVS